MSIRIHDKQMGSVCNFHDSAGLMHLVLICGDKRFYGIQPVGFQQIMVPARARMSWGMTIFRFRAVVRLMPSWKQAGAVTGIMPGSVPCRNAATKLAASLPPASRSGVMCINAHFHAVHGLPHGRRVCGMDIPENHEPAIRHGLADQAHGQVGAHLPMPVMKGDQLTMELMKIRPDLPVILCSGFSMNMSQKQADAAGIKAFLPKPILKNKVSQLAKAEGKNSSELVRELLEKYTKEKDTSAYIDNLWDKIGQNLTKLFAEGYNSIFTARTPDLEVVEDDPDDNKFIECAVALDCKIIISGDKHLKNKKNLLISISCLQMSLLTSGFKIIKTQSRSMA